MARNRSYDASYDLPEPREQEEVLLFTIPRQLAVALSYAIFVAHKQENAGIFGNEEIVALQDFKDKLEHRFKMAAFNGCAAPREEGKLEHELPTADDVRGILRAPGEEG